MGAFQDGMKLGAGIWDSGRANKRADEELGLRKAEADRQATKFGWEGADRTRIADAYTNYEVSTKPGVAAGLAPPTAAVDGEVPQAAAAPAPPKAPSKLDAIAARRALAVQLRSGPEAFAALDKEYGTAQEDELIGNAEFKPEDIKWLNQNHKSLTVKDMVDAKGKPTGYRLTDVSKDGAAVDHMISFADGKKLAGALAIVKTNPMRALDIIGGIDKNLAEIVARENGLVKDSVTTNNTATHFAHGDENDAKRTGIAAAGLKLQKDKANAENWTPIGVSEDGKGLAVYNRVTHQVKNQPLPDGVDAMGLFRILSGGGGAPGKDTPVPEAGTLIRKADGRLVRVGPNGEEFDTKAPDIGKRGEVLSKAGLPSGASERVIWGENGRHIEFNNMLYDSSRPADMKVLRDEMRQSSVNDVAAAEMQARGGYTPRRYSEGPALEAELQKVRGSARPLPVGQLN